MRGCCCPKRLSHFQILIGENSFAMRLCCGDLFARVFERKTPNADNSGVMLLPDPKQKRHSSCQKYQNINPVELARRNCTKHFKSKISSAALFPASFSAFHPCSDPHFRLASLPHLSLRQRRRDPSLVFSTRAAFRTVFGSLR
jgi:hypothetical protein